MQVSKSRILGQNQNEVRKFFVTSFFTAKNRLQSNVSSDNILFTGNIDDPVLMKQDVDGYEIPMVKLYTAEKSLLSFITYIAGSPQW